MEPTINITNLIGTLVIIGDKNNPIDEIVKETLVKVINSVSEIQLENSDKSEQQSKCSQNSNSDYPE